MNYPKCMCTAVVNSWIDLFSERLETNETSILVAKIKKLISTLKRLQMESLMKVEITSSHRAAFIRWAAHVRQ